VPRARPEALDVATLRLGERPAGLGGEQVGVAEHRVDRRADLVAHRRGELTLGRAHRLGGRTRLLRHGGRLERRVRRPARREVARDLGEAQQHAVTLAEAVRVTPAQNVDPSLRTRRPSLTDSPCSPAATRWSSAVPSSEPAVRVEHPEVAADGLVDGPPLHQSGALAPVRDDPVGVQQEDGVSRTFSESAVKARSAARRARRSTPCHAGGPVVSPASARAASAASRA
jgi:hypothetical protein